MSAAPPRRWDIFCRVIDNFGDIGVSWRLARQLALEQGAMVRLWVDNLAALRALCPEVDIGAAEQTRQGVHVFPYIEGAEYPPPAEVVIDAFGCGLPPRYLAQMAKAGSDASRTVWIVLEYLSAEPWVREYHRLPSPHPQTGLPRHFFFPGVAAGTGGVLRESTLLAKRDAFDADEHSRKNWWAGHGFDPVPQDAVTLSLFAYPYAPWRELLAACEVGSMQVVVAIPDGALASAIRDARGAGAAKRVRRGNLELRFVPFVPQVAYDELLWASDINFVRGEDSFVRAQWAGRPFVWHIYPQAEAAHEAKLRAFLDTVRDVLPAEAVQPVRDLWLAWNGAVPKLSMAQAWQGFLACRQAQRPGLQLWREKLLDLGDLAANLHGFCHGLMSKK